MIELPLSLKAWKAQPGTDVVVTLYDFSITDAITARLVEGNPKGGPITYDGNVYTPASIVRSDFEQAITGEIGSFQLTVSNVDGIAGGYIERYPLDGRRVTITTVPLDTLLPADAFVETWTIMEQAYNREAASIRLGYANLFKRKLPWRRYERPRCLHDWENRFNPENGCNFPSDQFDGNLQDGGDTVQLLSVGAVTDGEQKRQYGWYTSNILKASDATIDYIARGQGLFLATNSADSNWSGTSRNGPYVYKKITGDFDVYTRHDPIVWRDGGLMGLLCQEDSDGDSWVFLARTMSSTGDIRVTVRASIDGSQEVSTTLADPNPRYLRMRRIGDVFSLYTSTVENASWALLEDRTVPMTAGLPVRIGFACGGGSDAGGIGGVFKYFRVTAGGPSTCDRTQEGVDGCRVKDNIHRIFAFGGIPKR